MMMNDWLIWHDDGHTPAVFMKEVKAETMADALKESGVDPKLIWLCTMKSEADNGNAIGQLSIFQRQGIYTGPESIG
jgi:hypothetical protein